MGLTNSIIIKENVICPLCKKDMRHPIKEYVDFQSKDMSSRMNSWNIGDRITIEDGKLKFAADGNAKWKGVTHCYSCNEGVTCDIRIEKGIITKIENLRKFVI